MRTPWTFNLPELIHSAPGSVRAQPPGGGAGSLRRHLPPGRCEYLMRIACHFPFPFACFGFALSGNAAGCNPAHCSRVTCDFRRIRSCTSFPWVSAASVRSPAITRWKSAGFESRFSASSIKVFAAFFSTSMNSTCAFFMSSRVSSTASRCALSLNSFSACSLAWSRYAVIGEEPDDPYSTRSSNPISTLSFLLFSARLDHGFQDAHARLGELVPLRFRGGRDQPVPQFHEAVPPTHCVGVEIGKQFPKIGLGRVVIGVERPQTVQVVPIELQRFGEVPFQLVDEPGHLLRARRVLDRRQRRGAQLVHGLAHRVFGHGSGLAGASGHQARCADQKRDIEAHGYLRPLRVIFSRAGKRSSSRASCRLGSKL